MTVLETARLRLRRVNLNDAELILELVNEPSWLQQIGDRGVRSIDDARVYIFRSYLSRYPSGGHGLYLVERKNRTIPIGVCGLLRREGVDGVDLGYALLSRY